MEKPILLLYPPYEGKNYLSSRTPFALGLLSIATYLEERGIKAKVVDTAYPPNRVKINKPLELQTGQFNYFRFGWTNKEIKDWLDYNKSEFYKIVGISSLMSSNWTGAYNLAKIVKECWSNSIIVMGGPHVTSFPEHMFEKSFTDYICIGEGEDSFYKFLNEEHQEAIIHRDEYKGGTIQRNKNTFIKDVDQLPLLNRSLLTDERESKEMYIIFGRGCPHKCSFCCNFLLQGRIWRHKSIKRCMEEILYYNKNWGVQSFVVEDDNLCPNKNGINFLKDLCRSIIEQDLKLKFRVSHGIPTYATADEELCDLLWKARFRKMVFPLESTDKEVLNDMNKEFTIDYYETAINNWKKYERECPTEIIIGYPFVQTIESMLKTMFYIADHECLIWASHFRLNKGIQLFERCLEAGYINKDYDPINQQSPYISTERFNTEDIHEVARVSRGLNYITEAGCKVFSQNPFNEFNYYPEEKGDVIGLGNFKFKRSQDIAASILLASTGNFRGKPIVRIKDNSKLVYYRCEQNKVFGKMIYILTGKEIIHKGITDFFNK